MMTIYEILSLAIDLATLIVTFVMLLRDYIKKK